MSWSILYRLPLRHGLVSNVRCPLQAPLIPKSGRPRRNLQRPAFASQRAGRRRRPCNARSDPSEAAGMVRPGDRRFCHFCRPIRGLCFVNARRIDAAGFSAKRRCPTRRASASACSCDFRSAKPTCSVIRTGWISGSCQSNVARSPTGSRHDGERPSRANRCSSTPDTSRRGDYRGRCDDRPPGLQKMPGLPFARTRQERARPEPRRHRRQEVG